MKKLILFITIFLVSLSVYPTSTEAANASLTLSPSGGTFNVGDRFSVLVKVAPGSTAINAAYSTLTFNTDKLAVEAVSKSGSIFNLWTGEPSFSNIAGTIEFSGGLSNPGFSGFSGTLLTITFRAKQEGTGIVQFSSGAVLANDGFGTNVLSSMGRGSYILKAEGEPTPSPSQPQTGGLPTLVSISSSTHAEQNKWYANNNLKLEWSVPSGTTAVSYAIDNNSSTNPKYTAPNLARKAEFNNLLDGVWYFHINFKNNIGWGPVTHRKVLNDTKPPNQFEIVVDDRGDPTHPSPILYFESEDTLSGLDYYTLKIGSGDVYPVTLDELASNPYVMPLQAPGTHSVLITALDKAGNSISADIKVTIEPIDAPKVDFYTKELFLGEKVSVRGSGISGAEIDIYVKRGGEDEVRFAESVSVDEEGKWSLKFDSFLFPSNYSFHVIQRDQRGALSSSTEDFAFTVHGFIKIGGWKISGFVVVVLFIILGVLSTLALVFVVRKLQNIRKNVRKETRDAKRKLHTSVDILKEEIVEELRKLEHVKSERAFSQEEKRIEK